MKPVRALAVAGMAGMVIALTALQSPAQQGSAAQQDTPRTPSAPPLAPGDGSVHGRVVGPADVSGIAVVLYGLAPDGRPGVGDALTDGEGRFAFEGVAGQAGMAYLIGARYADIPFFGPRLQFEAGQKRLDVEIEVSEPSADASAVRVAETRIRLEQLGGQLLVYETQRLENTGREVVWVPEAGRADVRPAFVGALPERARDFESAALSEGVERKGDTLRFWGPVYPGEQELRYRYALPAEDDSLALALHLPRGSARLRVLSPENGVRVESASDALRSEPLVEVEGRRYASLVREDVAPGERLELRIELPATRNDPAALSLTRADLWLELDDTALVVSEDLRLGVAPGARLAGSAEQPLLRLSLPEGAELLGLAPESSALGLQPSERGLDLVGPLPPGESVIQLRYRLAARPDGVQLERRYPAALDVLNVLAADTGLVIESERLHRRRPIRSGTRSYLRREAYHLQADETVALRLRPIERGGVGRAPLRAAALLGMAIAAAFLVAPLLGRGRSRPTAASERAELAAAHLSRERDAIYQDIRDLDHDFDTGKLSSDDYEPMRGALRARAVELLRRERDGAAAQSDPVSRHCTACGAQLAGDWRFCAACGQPLPDAGARGA